MFSALCCRLLCSPNRLISSPAVGWEFLWSPRTLGRTLFPGARLPTSQHCWFPWQPGHCLVQFCKYFPKPFRPKIFCIASQICLISSNIPTASTPFNLPQLVRQETPDSTAVNLPDSRTEMDVRENQGKGAKVGPRLPSGWLPDCQFLILF